MAHFNLKVLAGDHCGYFSHIVVPNINNGSMTELCEKQDCEYGHPLTLNMYICPKILPTM